MLNDRDDRESKASRQHDRQPAMVVGIGASAGGRKAIQAFFSTMPADSGLAFVVIEHAEDAAANPAPQTLAGQTTMPVEEIWDGARPAANHVYVAPAHAVVQLEGGVFRVGTPDAPEEERRAIDTFFNSLADDRQAGAIGIILSGSGTDGSLGLKAISDSGGMTMVQEPATAGHESMPRSGATLGVADRVLPPEQMPAELLAYARHLKSLLLGDDGGTIQEQIGGALGTICEVLEKHTEHNFKHYKTSTLVRRIGRRMQILRISSAAAYLERLEQDPEEVKGLFRELLIGVTCFFRDADAFDALARQAIAKILENRGPRDPVRIWVPGCATGEEAYSLAILIREALDSHPEPPEVQIFASDINERALNTARLGIYARSIADDVTPERLDRFFVERGNRFVVSKQLRELCLFSVHDLIRDPPFSRLDLISCRNLLIYLGPHLQQKLIPLFHYALRPGGFLFLGPSESVANHGELFQPVDARHRIARRLPTTVRSHSVPARYESHRGGQRGSSGNTSSPDADIHILMQRIVLDEFAPKSVVVNAEAQIICSSTGLEKYLAIGAGNFQNNVVKLARSGLRVGIRTALNEALESRRTVTRDDIALKTDKGVERIRLTVQPMPQVGEGSGLFLLVFADLGLQSDLAENRARPTDEDADALIEHLEAELLTTREDLERTIQETETANEELKSSNEELLSMNEELQSANEELETSRDEIQSANDALARINSDLENLLASTRIATIFLDEKLKIHRYTPAVTAIYNLIPGDVSRPLSDITHRAVQMPPLPGNPAQLDSSAEDEIQTIEGRRYIRRVLPYRTAEGRPQGLVITFLDVTDLKKAEASLRDREMRLALALDAGGMGAWEWDVSTNAVIWNHRMFALLGLDPTATSLSANTFLECVHPDDLPTVQEAIRAAIEGEADYSAEFRVVRPDGTECWLAGIGKVDRDAAGRPTRMHGVNFEITKRKQAEDDLRESAAQFRALAESIPQLAWMAEPDGHVFWYNRRWYEYTGTSLEEMAGWGWQSVHDPEILPTVMVRWETSIRSGETFEMVFPLRGADGAYRTFLTRVEPVKDARGNVVRWFGTNTDIEDQKRSEDALKQANRHKDEFLAMLAHELRNPLSPIRNAVHLLKYVGPDNAMLVGARDMIDRQVTHLVRLVDDLLDISRITRGKIDLRKQPVDARTVLDRAVESVKPLIDARRQELTVTLPRHPVMVEADSTRLAQVVLNLLNNSAKYTEEGGRIWLTLEQNEKDAAIRVRDNGMGIAPELLPRIFDLFTQAERTLDRSQGGLGIGLTLVRRLVEMQGGTVQAHSAGPGQGSEFIVYIPLAPQQGASMPPPARAEQSIHSPESRRVLVIDDNVDAANSLSLLLRHLGHEVETAHDGIEALELARSFRPAIVFCDIGLPGMDGYEVARRLRALAETSEAALIALTGYGQDRDRIDAGTAGFHVHLLKPLELDSLQNVLRTVLEKDRPPPGSTGA